MVTKADIKKLLSKGLTGKEAARLILQDSWEVDHKREGFLSESDIKRIKAGLQGSQAEEYNKLIHVYQLVDYTLKDAHILALEVRDHLWVALTELGVYIMEDRIRGIQYLSPAIVTQKQYDDLKARQKEARLKELYSLWSAIDSLAHQVAPPEVAKEAEEAEEDDLASYLLDRYPELYRETVQQIIQLIRDGKLRPVQMDEQARQSLQEVHKLEEEHRLKEQADPTATEPDFWAAIVRKKDDLLRASYDRIKSRLTQKDLDELIRLLEWYVQTDTLPAKEAMSDEEQKKLIDYTFCSVEELIQAGIYHWMDTIDEYIPDLDEETGARPAGMMQSTRVAIIQNPGSYDLDERGYWKERDLLSSISGYAQRSQYKTPGEIPDFLKALHHIVSEKIKAFLALQAVTGAISDVIGIKLTEDLESWYGDIEVAISTFNSMITPASQHRRLPHYLGMPELKAFKIGKLKPTARSLKYYRERMAIALGDDWWREAYKTLDFQADEEDSLAGKVAEDIREVRDYFWDKEAENGQE